MANPNDNLRRLYQNGLKHFSLPDFDTFQKDMMDEEKRRRFYTNMQNAYTLPDFDTFSTDIGAVTVAAPAPVQTAARPQHAPSPAAPVADSTAKQAAVKPTVQTSPQPSQPSQPSQPEGWKPSAMQQRAFQRQMEEANARLKKQGEEFQQRMEGIKKGNKSGAFMGEREYDPTIGEMGKTYYTTQGERVSTQMQHGQANTAYHQWWENNTEAGQRSKEQRQQREFDARLAHLWQRHNPAEGENAAEQAWSAAEKRQGIDASRIAGDVYRDRGDAMSNAAFLGGRESHIMNAAENSHRKMGARFTNFDLDRLMDDSWDNLGEDGQKSLIEDCYQMLRYRNPGADELVLYNNAKELARQQSDLRLYTLAVEKNRPKNELDYLMRKIGDMNMLANVSKGLAVSQAGSTGDMAAYEAANEEYRQDGHKVLDVAGTVAGFALDPTTWISAGVGGAATKGAMWAGGRWLAGRGASAAVTKAATRQFASSMTGRVLGGIVGGSVNFGTFEGIKEMEGQFAHGGKVSTMDENGNLLREGRYVNEGYSASAVGGQAMHGLLMGGAIGWLGPVTGNVSDKLVRGGELFGKAMPGVSSTAGKVMTRAGLYTGATVAEGTIFSVPEWIEGKRDGFDVWTDNMAMMVGFKGKHMLKSASGVLGDLKASFDSPTNGRKNRLDFESRLRQRMDAPTDGGLALTKDEQAELKRYGYDLRDLVESAERTGDAAKGELITSNAPEIVSRLTDMVKDPRVSEAARAKMYYYATGRMLPMSTVMKGELFEDEEGGFTVESQGANGVITSRTFKSRKAADLELERINRQAELNSLELGERYQQTADFESRLQDACRTVAEENGWDMVEVYRTCEEARRNYLRGVDKQHDEVQQNILRKVTEAMGEFEETGVTDAMRGRINEKHGVDIDAAIRKEANRRTKAEQAAIDEYIAELIPDKAKKNPIMDVEAEDITNQKLLTDDATDFTSRDEEPIDPRFEGEEEVGVDPHKPAEQPIGRAVMKYQDRPVEVLSGRVVMTEDGTMVDNERSDASIVIRDIETGKVEMVAPESILFYEEYTTPAEEGPAAPTEPAPESEDVSRPKYTSGQIKIRNSDGTETRGVLTGYVDENGNHEYYVEGDLQHLHYASEHELDNILSDYQPDAPQEPVEPQQPADRPTPEGVTNVEDYDKGYSAGIDEVRGFSNEALATAIGKLRNEAATLTDFGRGLLEAYEYEQQSRAMEGVAPNDKPADANVGLDGPRHAHDVGAPEPVGPRQPDAPREPTPLQRIPRNEKGKPVFEQAESAEHGWDALVEHHKGDAAKAKVTADLMTENKRKALEKAKKLKPKGDDPDEILASQEANEATLVQAEREYNLWQQIAGVEQARQDAIRSQRDAEARRLAAERAEAEKAEREEAGGQGEGDTRQPTDNTTTDNTPTDNTPTNNTLPDAEVRDWKQDRPEDARQRGYWMVDGQRVERQPELPMPSGARTAVKFDRKNVVEGANTVIEADRLQPSHLDGSWNPRFMLPEAQPKKEFNVARMVAATRIASEMTPEEITGGVTAYTGAPVVNRRGESIQGTGRGNALRIMWEQYPEQAAAYKAHLMELARAGKIDKTPEEIEAMRAPVNVRMLDVDDAEAIRLGNISVDNTESGGRKRMEPHATAAALTANSKTGEFVRRLFDGTDEDMSLVECIRERGYEVVQWLQDTGVINETQYATAVTSQKNREVGLTDEAAADLRAIVEQTFFGGGPEGLREQWRALPDKAQKAILATSYKDMSSAEGSRIIDELHQSVAAYSELSAYPAFRDARNVKEALRAVDGWASSMSITEDGGMLQNREKYSNLALHLAALYRGESQKAIRDHFNRLYELIQGTHVLGLEDMMEGRTEADFAPRSLTEAVKDVFGIDYEPTRRRIDEKDSKQDGRVPLAGGGETGTRGSGMGRGGVETGERGAEGRGESERGAGAAGDGRGGGIDTRGGEKEETVSQKLSKDEATDIITKMEMSAVRDPKISLSPESWQNTFGLSNSIDTPLGKVKMGEGQYQKLVDKKRSAEFGMVVQTLQDPDVVFIEPSEAKDGQITERGFSYVFVKTFIRDGKKFKYYTSVSVLKDGMEVSVSSHIASKTAIMKKLQGMERAYTKESLLPNSSEWHLAEHPSDVPDLLPTQGKSEISERKVNNSASDKQEKGAESSVQTSDNKGEQSVQSAVEAASAQVNTSPTPGQAQAGNYKKGHVTIGEFDITIENPAGSVRKGVDADGKEWSTTMANAYGYIKGTESADGDHIDVFLHQNMDEWNGRKVYVVDQTNTDGSFDEHKVMLGFNDKDEAMTAYLANYDKTWADTHPGIRISETNIEDFNKWVQSSHRKTKPFADYSTVSKVVDEVPVKPEAPQADAEAQKDIEGTYEKMRSDLRSQVAELYRQGEEEIGWYKASQKIVDLFEDYAKNHKLPKPYNTWLSLCRETSERTGGKIAGAHKRTNDFKKLTTDASKLSVDELKGKIAEYDETIGELWNSYMAQMGHELQRNILRGHESIGLPGGERSAEILKTVSKLRAERDMLSDIMRRREASERAGDDIFAKAEAVVESEREALKEKIGDDVVSLGMTLAMAEDGEWPMDKVKEYRKELAEELNRLDAKDRDEIMNRFGDEITRIDNSITDYENRMDKIGRAVGAKGRTIRKLIERHNNVGKDKDIDVWDETEKERNERVSIVKEIGELLSGMSDREILSLEQDEVMANFVKSKSPNYGLDKETRKPYERAAEVFRAEQLRKVAEGLDDKFEELPQVEGKARGGKKFSLTDVVSKDKVHVGSAIAGVYHDGESKVAVSSDTHVLVVSAKDYDSKHEGNSISSKGEVLKGNYPAYKRILPVPENDVASATMDDSVEALLTGGMKSAKEKTGEKGEYMPVLVMMSNGVYGVFFAGDLRNFFRAAAHIGAKTIELNRTPYADKLVARGNGKDVVMLMGMNPQEGMKGMKLTLSGEKVETADTHKRPIKTTPKTKQDKPTASEEIKIEDFGE